MILASPPYLGQLVPELIKIREDLGMDFWTADTVDVSQDTQYPPPKDEGRISMPTSQGPTSNDADIVSQTLTAVCMVKDTKAGEMRVFRLENKLRVW